MGSQTTTMGIGLNQSSGVAQQYIPPNVIAIPSPGPPPPEVVYGAAQVIADGSALPAGTWLVSGAGLEAVGNSVTVYPVTITNGPTPP